MLPDVLSVVVRALSFVCALQAGGIAMFLVVFATNLVGAEDVSQRARSDNSLGASSSVEIIRRLGWWSAVAAVPLVALHYALEASRMAGDLTGVWDPSLQKFVATSGTALAAGLRLLGLVLIAIALHRKPRAAGQPPQGGGDRVPASVEALGPPRLRFQVCLGALLISASFAATGHTAADLHRWLLAVLLVTHLLVVQFWLGALLPLLVLSGRAPACAARTVRRFSRVATALVPLILIAGVAMAWVLLPDLGALGEPYGQLLLAKAAGFAGLMALAALNKWMLGPGLEKGDGAGARRFGRSVSAEYVLVVAVLAITAVMTSFFSPER